MCWRRFENQHLLFSGLEAEKANQAAEPPYRQWLTMAQPLLSLSRCWNPALMRPDRKCSRRRGMMALVSGKRGPGEPDWAMAQPQLGSAPACFADLNRPGKIRFFVKNFGLLCRLRLSVKPIQHHLERQSSRIELETNRWAL
jgi:hypothetical protein